MGAVAVVGVGALAVTALRGDGGGADSPEAAVEDLIVALDEEDPLAALAAMNPEEVEALSDVVESASERAATLGFSPDERTFGGVDLAVSGQEYEVDELGDGVAKVTITDGSADIDVEVDDLGGATRGLIEQEAAESGDEVDPSPSAEVEAEDLIVTTDDGDEVEPFLVAVERGGGWYVSPLHTAAQYLVEGLGLDDPEVPAPDAGDGAESPEAAVEEMLVALAGADVARTGDLAAGDTGAAVRSYAGAIEEWLDEEVEGSSAEIDTFEAEVEDRDGGGRRVVVTELEGTLSWTDDDGDELTSTIVWDGECLTVGDAVEAGEEPDEDEEPVLCLDGMAGVGIDELAVAVVEQDGGWRVDPLATVTDYAAAIVPELDESTVLRVLGTPQAAEPSETIPTGEVSTVALGPAGTAVVTVELEADTAYTVDASVEDEDVDVDVDVLGPDGDRLGSSSVETTDAGAHQVVIVAERWAAADAEVLISPVQTEALAVGEEASGSIDETTRVVAYEADLAADTSYTLTYEGEDLFVSIDDPEGGYVDLTTSDDGSATVGTFTTTTAGTHRISVETLSEGATSDFTLTLDEGGAGGGGEAFVLGNGESDSATGELVGPDDEQYIDIEVQGGRTVVADVIPDADALDVVLILRDPETNEEIDRYDSNGPGISEGAIFTPDTTTTWRIAVQGKNDSAGSYVVEAYVDE